MRERRLLEESICAAARRFGPRGHPERTSRRRVERGVIERDVRRIGRVALSTEVLDNAATMPPQRLGTADAIHLASALAIRRDLSAFVAYDKRLLEAAAEAGLPVASPS